MAATETVVVDASALLPLILPDVPGRKRFAVDLVTDAEAGRIRLLVPQVCHLELAAAVTKKVRAGVIAVPAAAEFFELVDSLSLDTVVESMSARELFEAAMRLGCQVADSIYVEMARDLGATLATLDGGMLQACRAAGVATRAVFAV